MGHVHTESNSYALTRVTDQIILMSLSGVCLECRLRIQPQDIKQKEPPQKYRLGTISNTKLLAGLNRFYRILTSPSASAVVHNI